MFGLGGFFGQFGSFAPAYTISYELLYYFLWVASRAVFKRFNPLYIVLINAAFAIAAISLAPLVKQMAYSTGLGFFADIFFNQFALMIFLPWLIGAALVSLLEPTASYRPIHVISEFSWLLLFLYIAFSAQIFGMPAFFVDITATVHYVGLGVCFSLVIISAYRQSISSQPNRSYFQLGLLSYPIYLAHGPVIVFLAFFLSSLELDFSSTLILLVCCSTLAGTCLVFLIEKPVLSLRANRLRTTKVEQEPVRHQIK